MKKKAAGGEEEICRRRSGYWRCKDAASADNRYHYCEKHNKELEIKRKSLPQDEQLCRRTGDNGRWRCKDFRINSEIKYCEKHYYNWYLQFHKKKKTCPEGAGPTQEIRASKRGKKDDTSDTIVEGGGSDQFGTKRKNVERTEKSGELKSVEKTVIETRASKRRKKVTENVDWSLDETEGIQPSNNDDTCGGTANFKRKRKTVENAEGSGKLESLTRTRIQRDNVPATTNDTSDCDAIIEGGTANIGRNRKTIESTEESSRDLEYLTRARGPVVDLESLEYYKSKCFELSAELEMKKVELDKKDVDHEKTRMELAKKNAEHEKTQVELQINNVEHEQTKAELEKKKLECTELQGRLAEVETKLTAANDILDMSNWNRNKHPEIKWKSEEDMLSSIQENLELCMKAVCALYRQHIYVSGGETSSKGLHFDCDTLRCTTLAMFLMDGDCNGDLKKSLKELAAFDDEAVSSCKKLAKRYSTHLFDIYQKGDDPYFPSMCNCRPRRSNC